jgi:hypothetical protein
MTKIEREAQIQSSLFLGPMFPLYGVVEDSSGLLVCECKLDPRRSTGAKCSPGKHPRWGKWKQKATQDPERVREWLRQFPNANFGVVTGTIAIVIDVDVRPGGNALATLENLQFDVGKRIPDTVQVETGRGGGSRHLYFAPPPHVTLGNRSNFLPGLDIRGEGGYSVAPGSRHIEGGYYRFAEDGHPDKQTLADLPGFVLETISGSAHQKVTSGLQKPSKESSAVYDTIAASEQPALSDSVVLGVMLRNKSARFYWYGGRRNPTASEDDFALASKLAFYCRHDLRQMYKLFLRSGLYRPKFLDHRPGGDYALCTLKRAIQCTPEKWIRKKRQRPSIATGAKKGRKTLPSTIAILDLHQLEPQLTITGIATQLDLPVKQVKDVIRYHCRIKEEHSGIPVLRKGPSRESCGRKCLESQDRAA